MRKLLAILLCKLGYLVGKPLGKGSSLPGKLALKVCPDILRRLKLPKYVVAVTGSNGKTSTVDLIAHVLTADGKKVAYNKEGSNQIEGVTTFLLNNATLGGKVKADVVLLESDERFARHTFKFFHPTHYAILNLFRDQMTRNGHNQWIYDIVKESVYPDSKLILNADDPMVARYGFERGAETVRWFGIEPQAGDTVASTGVYDDGAYCPACLSPMTYAFRHYNHVGSYRCEACGLHRVSPDYRGETLDLAGQTFRINGQAVYLALPNYYHAYNVLAAFAVCAELGVSPAKISESIGGYDLQSGRVVRFALGQHKGTLLTSKHENSLSYDQSLLRVVQNPAPCSVLVIVDAISRKYFTSETSWLFDVNFGLLKDEKVQKIFLAGKYCHDLAVRFALTDLPQEKITVTESIERAAELLKAEGEEDLFVVTCFSDKDKILSQVEVEK